MSSKKLLIFGIISLGISLLVFAFITKPWVKPSSTSSETQVSSYNAASAPEYDRSKTIVFETIAPTTQPKKSIELAQQYLEDGLYAEAIEIAKQERGQNPSNIDALKVLRTAYIQTKKFDEAVVVSQSLLQFSKTQEHQVFLIESLLLKGDTMTAQSQILALPRSIEKAFYEMVIAIVKEDHENIKAIATDLKNSSVEKYRKIGEQVLSVYSTYASFKDGSPHYLRTMLANILNILQFHSLVVDFLPQTLREYPDYRDAWILMGNSYLNLQRFSLAANILDKAVSLDPTHAKSPYYLAIALAEQGQFSDAIDQFESALLNGYTPSSKIHRYLGDIFFRQEKFDESFSYYQLILDSEDVLLSDYKRAVYIILEKQNSPDLALKLSTQSVQKFSSDAQSFILLAWSLYEKGEYEKSLKTLQKAESINPLLPDIFFHYGKIYEATNQYQFAFIAYKSCYEKSISTPLSGECAKLYNDLQTRLKDQ